MASNLNQEGFNKPQVEIFSGNNKPLKHIDGTLFSTRVSKFEYVYDEEGDDTCNIVFKFDDETLVDHPSLRQDTLIYIRWGYPNTAGGMSSKRLVAIRDTITNYDSSGIRHELICTDQVSYYKTMQHNINEQKGFMAWLAGLSDKLTDTEIRLFNPNLKMYSYVWKRGTQPMGGDLNQLNGLITVIKDNTAVVKPIAPGGMSIYRVIQEETKLLDDGPYLLDGRDGTLTIRPRNFGGVVIRTFNVGDGTEEVLSFIPKSKIRKNEMEATEYGSMNAEDATGTVGIQVDLDSPAFQDLENQTNPSAGFDSRAGVNVKKELHDMMRMGFDNGESVEDAAKIAASSTYDQHIDNRGGAYISTDGMFQSARDNLFFDESFYGLSRSLHWASEEIEEIAEKKLINLIKDKHHNKYQAELSVLGIPSLIVNRSIYIKGKIGRIHKGKYYIKRVNHRIDMSGYVCSMSLIKTPRNIDVIKQKNTLHFNEFNEGGAGESTFDLEERLGPDDGGTSLEEEDNSYNTP